MNGDWIGQLQERMQMPLPGKPAQHKMAHAVRYHYPPPPDNARVACVLLLLYPKNNQQHLVLIERMSNNEHDQHKGQISFPGGKLEEEDPSLYEGALREAEEEVGVDPQAIGKIGQLSDLYIPVSNFLVHPFIGKVDYAPQFIPQPSEVRSILEVPVQHLLMPSTRQLTKIKISNNMVLSDVPFYDVQGHIVWGATAMILSEFVEIIRETKIQIP